MESPIELQAVILTGGRDIHGPLLQGTGIESKVMLPVGDKPMVVSVLETLAQLRHQPRLWLSTQDPAIQSLKTDTPFEILPNDEGAVLSILKALDNLPAGEWVLFVSGDHPLLTPEMVEYFIDEAVKRDAALVAAVVERETVQRKYPHSQRTYFQARRGAYSGGNLFLINQNKFHPNFHFMDTIDRNRKQPWKSAFMLDLWSLVQIVCKRLTIEEVAKRASKALGCRADVVVMPYAECCMDVDKPSDKKIAELILAERHEEAAKLKHNQGKPV